MKQKNTKPWVKRCFLLALVLLLFAGVLYAVHYISLDREFNHNKKHFGEETYSEIFAIDGEADGADEILRLGREAFSCVGDDAEASFGILSRYCCSAASQEFTLEHIASKTDGKSGYVWVAYTVKGYAADGTLAYAGGSEDGRILSRWSVEKQNGAWIVTAIDEAP